VPDVRRQSLAGARARIVKGRCRVGRVTARHASIARGRVVSQSPRGGVTQPRGSRVDLVLSLGARPVPKPKFTG
jgi:beta-lactam-binding protein with PASTA domain